MSLPTHSILWPREPLKHLGPFCVNQNRVGDQGVEPPVAKREALQSCSQHGQGLSSTVILGVTHTGSCAGTVESKGGWTASCKSNPCIWRTALRLTSFVLFKNPQTVTLHNPDPLQDAQFRENTAFLSQNHINPRNQGCWQLLG